MDKIKETVSLIVNFTQSPLIVQLKTENYKEYEKYMKEIFPTFSESNPYLFKTILKGNFNISILDKMLDGLIKIETGKETRENIEKQLGEELANEYIPEHIREKTNK